MSEDTRRRGLVTPYLEKSQGFLIVWAIGTAFSTYFCMYAFRKPFSAAKYLGEDGQAQTMQLFGGSYDLKTVFVVSQIIGYCLSKYIGIKVCTEVTRRQRMVMLVGMIIIAHLSLLLFAVLPPGGKVLAIFMNGLPLGMVWGLVVWYLEGRRTSELLLAGLSCSYIIASGIVKDVGKALLDGAEKITVFALDVGLKNPITIKLPNAMSGTEVSEYWMPFAVGVMFFLPFLVSVFMLNQMPDPTREDELERTEREPMDGNHRWAFFFHFLPGLTMLCVAYFFLTAYRDFRDNYGVEIFEKLGYGETPAVFSRSETWVAFAVLVPLALLFLIKNNKWGLIGCYFIMTLGVVMLGVATLLLDAGTITGLQWMIMIGIGAYLAYVPYGSVLFDRLIAHTKIVGTAVFAVYLTDALGYTGSVFMQILKDRMFGDMNRYEFFRGFTYFMSIFGGILLVASLIYFLTRHGEGHVKIRSGEADGNASDNATLPAPPSVRKDS